MFTKHSKKKKEVHIFTDSSVLSLSLPAVSVLPVPDLGSPKGIRFSDVTDTSATVHWVTPRARVDNYRVTYVPAYGGQYFYECSEAQNI